MSLESYAQALRYVIAMDGEPQFDYQLDEPLLYDEQTNSVSDGALATVQFMGLLPRFSLVYGWLIG